MTGGRQLSVDGTSRVTGDGQARFRECLGVKSPGLLGRENSSVVHKASELTWYMCEKN